MASLVAVGLGLSVTVVVVLAGRSEPSPSGQASSSARRVTTSSTTTPASAGAAVVGSSVVVPAATPPASDAPGAIGTTASPSATTTSASSPSSSPGPSSVVPPSLATTPAGQQLLGRRALSWWGELVDGRIVVRGRINSQSAKSSALRNATTKADATHVVDELVVDPSVAPIDLGLVPLFVAQAIMFDQDRAALATSYDTLIGFSRYTLFSQPNVRLAVVGARDAAEPSALALDRAQAVADAIASKVIDASRLTVVTRPPTTGPASPSQDRRVELVFFGNFDA